MTAPEQTTVDPRRPDTGPAGIVAILSTLVGMCAGILLALVVFAGQRDDTAAYLGTAGILGGLTLGSLLVALLAALAAR